MLTIMILCFTVNVYCLLFKPLTTDLYNLTELKQTNTSNKTNMYNNSCSIERKREREREREKEREILYYSTNHNIKQYSMYTGMEQLILFFLTGTN